MSLAPLLNTVYTDPNRDKPGSARDTRARQETEEARAKWQCSLRFVVLMLKSWVGLVALASDRYGLHSLVLAINEPTSRLHDWILDALSEIFQLRLRTVAQLKQSSKLALKTAFAVSDLPPLMTRLRHDAKKNFLAMLLYAFNRAGLLEALTRLGKRVNTVGALQNDLENTINSKTTVLLGEILELGTELFPSSLNQELQLLPELVQQAGNFDGDGRLARSKATSVLWQLNTFQYVKRLVAADQAAVLAMQYQRLAPTSHRGSRLDELKKLIVSSNVDTVAIKTQLQECGTENPNPALWNWRLVADLLEGPLLPEAHLQVALKSKFFHRLLHYFKPKSELFSKLPWTIENNAKYTTVATLALQVLSTSTLMEAREFLISCSLLRDLKRLLKEEVRCSEKNRWPDEHPFSADSLVRTMSRDYFDILGSLSVSELGVEMLAKFDVWRTMEAIAQQSRPDLVRLLLTSLNFSNSAEPRKIMQTILRSPNKALRFVATRQLRVLARVNLQKEPV